MKMNKNSGVIVLVEHLWKRRMERLGEVACYQCEDPLHVDQEIFSRSATLCWPGSHYKYYCMDCARDLYFVEDEDDLLD